MQFRNNPEISTNWINISRVSSISEVLDSSSTLAAKRSYYEITADEENKKIGINFREEKQVIEGTADREESKWVGRLGFSFDTQFARDLLRFLQERVPDTKEEKL